MSARPPALATYRRTVGASLERVWENVHDWEHLPWLHRTSFRSIECLEEAEWGWRARVGLPPVPDGPELVIELRREPEDEAYVVTTLEGPGTGTRIVTRLTPEDATRTGVEVSFHVPGLDGEAARAVGQAYVTLYTRLWDEDESMMVRRAEELAETGPPAADERTLGARDTLALPHAFELGGRRFRLVEHDGDLLAHDARCPHRLGPLEDAPVRDGCIECPWHGYRFDVKSGRSSDGRGLRLGRAPEVIVDPDGTVRARLAAG